MNIDFKLKLPLVNIDDNTINTTLLVSAQLMLTPFYALESDVITPFTDLTDDQFPWIRKLLFNASLTVYRLTKPLEKLTIISKEDLFLLRRDFVICLVTNEMAKQLNKDLAASLSRSKTLGDFSVSTSKKGDNSVLLQILSDSSSCINEMKQLIEELEQSSLVPASFVKGQYNPKTRLVGRLWWNSELPMTLVDGYANRKYDYKGNKYKAGTFNLDYYHKYSGMSLSDYYQNIGVEE